MHGSPSSSIHFTVRSSTKNLGHRQLEKVLISYESHTCMVYPVRSNPVGIVYIYLVWSPGIIAVTQECNFSGPPWHVYIRCLFWSYCLRGLIAVSLFPDISTWSDQTFQVQSPWSYLSVLSCSLEVPPPTLPYLVLSNIPYLNTPVYTT